MNPISQQQISHDVALHIHANHQPHITKSYTYPECEPPKCRRWAKRSALHETGVSPMREFPQLSCRFLDGLAEPGAGINPAERWLSRQQFAQHYCIIRCFGKLFHLNITPVGFDPDCAIWPQMALRPGLTDTPILDALDLTPVLESKLGGERRALRPVWPVTTVCARCGNATSARQDRTRRSGRCRGRRTTIGSRSSQSQSRVYPQRETREWTERASSR
jgi:hypothetical protein